MARKRSQVSAIHGRWCLLTLLALTPTHAFGQAAQPGLPGGQPADKIVVSQTSAEIITIGTTKAMVDQILGVPRTGTTIFCLHRNFYTYRDGSEVVFVDGCAISAKPNGLAIGSPAQGFTIQREGKMVFFDPVLVCGSPIPVPGPIGQTKREVEEQLLFSPPMMPILQPPSVFSGGPCLNQNLGPINRLRLF